MNVNWNIFSSAMNTIYQNGIGYIIYSKAISDIENQQVEGRHFYFILFYFEPVAIDGHAQV